MMTTSRREFRKTARKTPPPFSLRLTFEERARLEAAANGMPLGAYIRTVLFDQDLPTLRRRGHRPVVDHEELGRVLAVLGASRLAQNVNQLAKAVNVGALPITPDTETALQGACANIAEMRGLLIKALGLTAEPPTGGTP